MQPSNVPSSANPEIVNGRYALVDRVGEGTFAVTYRAQDLALDRIVALKLLRPQFAADATFLVRFEREARAAARVNHPNVVQVYDYGIRDNVPYLVMQLVEGRDLKRTIQSTGPLPGEEVARIGDQILAGLGAIHQAGLIHRDIKPQNVLLDASGTAQMTDFGIAHNPANSLLTGDGTTLGTPSYMAPEQARGETVTTSADLYAVGVVLFELLTGRLPFSGDNPLTVMLAHVQNPPPAPSSVAPRPISPDLDEIVLRAMAKDPSDRYPDAASMAAALRAVSLGGQPVHGPANDTTVQAPSVRPRPPARVTAAVPPVAPMSDQQRDSRRGLAWLAPIVVIVLALLVWGGARAMNNRDDGNDSTPPSQGAAIKGTATTTGSLSLIPFETETPESSSIATETEEDADDSTSTPRTVRRATATRTATSSPTTEPTVTETPEPTETPQPTRTPRPPRPTSTPEPEEGPPTIAPSDDGDEDATSGNGAREEVSGASEPVSLTFGPGDWSGGYYRGDSGFLGRPWVAIYGAQSGLGRITLQFSIDTNPAGDATLTIVGINDEWASENPLLIEVNGVAIYNGPSPFPAWNGQGNGANAVWGSVEWTLPDGVLRAGTNEISISNLTPSAATNSPPYVDISTTTIEVR